MDEGYTMENIDQRVKALIDQHLDSDADSDAGSGDEEHEEFISEDDLGDEDEDEDEDGDEDEDEDMQDRTLVLDFEQGKYDRSKVLKMRGFVFEEYESNLESEPETPNAHYIDI